jgi:hypothetical protein
MLARRSFAVCNECHTRDLSVRPISKNASEPPRLFRRLHYLSPGAI